MIERILGLHRLISSILVEPLVHFCLIGAVLWGGVEYSHSHYIRYTIRLESADRKRIADRYFRQYGEMPSVQMLKELSDRYIREEIILREGLRLHLDQSDEIIRRRIIQKYEFLEMEAAAPDPPDTGVLKEWFDRHKEKYMTAEKVGFRHLYFSPDKDGWEASKSRALSSLQVLDKHRSVPQGDLFPGPAQGDGVGPAEARKIFGRTELSEQLFKSPAGQWTGPYRSGYGWHLIYITRRESPVIPEFDQVRDQVAVDYTDIQREIFVDRMFKEIRDRYEVQYAADR